MKRAGQRLPTQSLQPLESFPEDLPISLLIKIGDMWVHFQDLILYMAGNKVCGPESCPGLPGQSRFLHPARSVLPTKSPIVLQPRSHFFTKNRGYYAIHLEPLTSLSSH